MVARSKSSFFLAGLSILVSPVQEEEEDGRPALLPLDRPNVLVCVLDDVGVDLLSAYGEGPGQAACTPWIDSLAAGGLLFRNAWANPLCSPTRAQILTGRHGFRTGVGLFVNRTNPGAYFGLPASERTIAEGLVSRGYTSAVFGKWHLATGDVDPADPLNQGFQWFEGTIAGNLDPEIPGGCPTCPEGCRFEPPGFYRWVKSTNGVETCDRRYATTATVDDALAATGRNVPEPWFQYTSLHAIHSPYHVPPAHLCPGPVPCTCDGTLTTNLQKGKAALEAADAEIGRLITTLRATSTRPLIVFLIGDNGTAGPVAEGPAGGCFDSQRSKGTLYEGGVNVPLIAWGPGILPGEVDALVCATDLHATVLELAGAKSRAEDSVSLVKYLRGFQGDLRETVYAERFTPNGLPFAPTTHRRAIRNARYKLIRQTGLPDELYDLVLDPCETTDLYPPTAGSPEQAAYESLNAELVDLGVG